MYQLCYEEYYDSEREPLCVPKVDIPDINEFQSSLMILTGFRRNIDRINYVETAYQQFVHLQTTLQYPTRIGLMNLERGVRSFFVEFDIFLNRWEKLFKNHPNNVELLELYNQLTHNIFDNSNDYAMASILRDYCTHTADVIEAIVWGGHTAWVGCNSEALLKDKHITKTKKEIIRNYKTTYISLEPIMKGALEELKKLNNTLIVSLLNDDIRKASELVSEMIQEMKKQGDRNWVFMDIKESELLHAEIAGEHIKYVKGKAMELFRWKEFARLITIIEHISEKDDFKMEAQKTLTIQRKSQTHDNAITAK